MADFFVTFGQIYRDDPHPVFNDAHPDGWVRIQADDISSARRIAFRNLGDQWAFIYRESEFDRSIFPRGELGCFNE